MNNSLLLKLSCLFFLMVWTTNAISQDKEASAIVCGSIIFEKDSLIVNPKSIILQKEWPISYKKYAQMDIDTSNYSFKSIVDLNQITYGNINIIYSRDFDTIAMERERFLDPAIKLPANKNKYALMTLFLDLKFVLEPGDSLNIVINYNKPDIYGKASVFFSGIGAANNNLLKLKDHQRDLYKESFKMPLEEGLKHEDLLLKESLTNINEAKDSISNAYFNLLKTDIIFENLRMKHALIRASLYGSEIGIDKKRSIARKHYSYLDTLTLSSEYLNSIIYRKFLDSYLEYLNRIITGKDIPFGYNEKSYWMAKSIFDDPILKIFLYERLATQMEIPFSYNNTVLQYKDFIKRFPNTPESYRLTKTFSMHYPVSNGQVAPDLRLVNSTGKKKDLSDLKGKVVVLSTGQALMNVLSNDKLKERIESFSSKYGDDFVIVALGHKYQKSGALSEYVDYYLAEDPDSDNIYPYIFLSSMRYNFIIGKDGIINDCVRDIYNSGKKISKLISQKYTVFTRIKNATKDNKNELILLLSILISLTIIFLISSKIRQRKQELIRRQLNSELKAIRSQLNPHFLFNSLNSIQNFINKSDSKTANIHLSKFSLLMRRIIELSEKESITLAEELDFNRTYIELEQLRYGFSYKFEVDDSIDQYNTEIPGMTIQPFIENAIVHCMADLGEMGELFIFVKRKGEDHIMIEITDNGKGFPLESGKGFGLKSSRERIDLLNSQNKENIELYIESRGANDEINGTTVKLIIPKKY